MKWTIAFFMSALLVTALAGVSYAVWTGHLDHSDHLRVIHYDTNYDLSAQRRMPAE
jgi:hypothetical protein